jgi:hypothetical protein
MRAHSVKIQKKQVRFRDEIEGKDIREVFIIESYKEYYLMQDNEAKCACTCSIF